MPYFLTLGLLSAIFFTLVILLWKKTGNMMIVIGMLLLYYWTLAGAWFIIYDQLTGNAGERWGLHYYSYFDKLFPVALNPDYLRSILYYGIFLISIAGILWWRAPATKNASRPKQEPIAVHHGLFILISLVSMAASFLLVRTSILDALHAGESIYAYTRLHPNHLFTLHQIANEVSIISLMAGIAILLNRNSGFLLQGQTGRPWWLAYGFNFILVVLYLMILGNKHDLLLGGLIGCFILWRNESGRARLSKWTVYALMVLLPLMSVDAIRGFTWKNKAMTATSPAPVVQEKKSAAARVSGIIDNILFNDEMFAAHMSMYGAVHFKIEPTWGSSVVALSASFVPRAVLPNRPPDIYAYYTRGIHYHEEQGFTIHHATGWYLNFGWPGVVLGGCCFGWLWSWLLRRENTPNRRKLWRVFFFLAPYLLAAFIPNFIRSGMEVYKAVLLEGICIPCLIIFAATLIPPRTKAVQP